MSALISFLPIQLGWHRANTITPVDHHNSTADRLKDAVTTWVLRGANESLTAAGDDEEDIFQCMLDLSPVYAVVSSMISFYLPCIAMTFFYYRMHRYARRHAETIKRAGYYSRPALVIDDASTGVEKLTPRRSIVEKLTPRRSIIRGGGGVSEHKAAITLGVIMGVFLLCWLPFFTINVVTAFCGGCVPPIIFSAFTWLGYLNSTMNPVIYSVFNRQFRDAFKRVLHLRRRNSSITGVEGIGRGSEWEEASRGQTGVARRRTEDGRLSARPSVSDAGINSVLKTSSSFRDVAAYERNMSCL